MAAGVLIVALLIYHSMTGQGGEGHGHQELPPYWGIGILPFSAGELATR